MRELAHEDGACRASLGPRFGVWNLYFPRFNGVHATARFRTLFAGVFMVDGERKTRRQFMPVL